MINRIISTLGGKFTNERKLDILANNVANAATPGFKAHRVAVGVTAVTDTTQPDDLQQTYVYEIESYVHFSDAPMVETGNNLDLAIEGSGFFVVSTPQGNMYTRNGQFTLDSQKKLVTANGETVQGQSGSDITIDGRDIKIETDGSIFVDGSRIDGIKIVDFANKNSLRNSGNSLFINTDITNGEITPDQFTLRQGAYEASNVSVMTEMVELISTLRAYETYAKVDQITSETLQKLIDMGK
jgi:flagellar basal-body rod protein FlgF